MRARWIMTAAIGLWALACVPVGNGSGGDDADASTDATPSDGQPSDGQPTDATRPEGDGGPGAMCGDGRCDPSEGCAACPTDCGCSPGEQCDPEDGMCLGCQPECDGQACGPDGCGGACGVCPDDRVCDAEGQCASPPAACGDGVCGDDEDCATCSDDCGVCCGDGQCGVGEDCATCPADCGSCCGDTACRPDQGEDCATCPADCGCPDGQLCEAADRRCVPDGPRCGDAACDPDETCGDCPADCGECCGDGVCDPDVGEDCGRCPGDCGCPVGAVCDAGQCVDPPAACGDGACGGDESCQTCPADCGACCGDGACTPEHGETCETCPADCRCPEGEACGAGVCACAPRCDGRVCGDDGCGGVCGQCPAGADCADGLCVDQARCGDGRCDAGEDCTDCRADCGCPAGELCDPIERVCACAPQCDGRACGPDGCGGVCGACGPDAACVDGACALDCPDDCGPLWTQSCTGDGFGSRLCAPDLDRPGCTAPSRRIPCAEGRACDDGACAGGCVVPEVMVLVDRSSSMVAGDRWGFARRSIDDMVDAFGSRARLGVRAFPARNADCSAGEIQVPAFDNGPAFAALPAPDQSAQTPILAAFDALEPAFGDPDEGETIVLITDGDETCADEDAVVDRVEALRARGVRTFAVGISRQANGELLDRIAVAGGTARNAAQRFYLVEDQAALTAALSDIFTRLEVCPCAPGDRQCDGDRVLTCRADRNGFEPAENCQFGCDPDTTACHPVCRPGGDVYDCDGDRALACNDAGDGFGPDGVACPLGCGAPSGCFGVCRAGETRCVDADTVETCRPDGSGWAPSPCPDICVLEDDACGEGGVCLPDDLRCDDAGLTICDGQGAGFAVAVECPDTCQPYNARCPTDQLGDAYEIDGVFYVRGPDGWGGVTDIDGRGVTWGCFLMGYSRSSQRFERVAAAHPAGQRTYRLTCDGARWLGECEMVRSDRAGRAGNGLELDCGAPPTGSSQCVGDDFSLAYLGEGVHRPYRCLDGCSPEQRVCRATVYECDIRRGAVCPLLEHEGLVARNFGGANVGRFDVLIGRPVETGISIYSPELNPVCEGGIEVRVTDEDGAVVGAANGGCSSLFTRIELEPGSYELTLSNPGAARTYDLNVVLNAQGPRTP